MSRYRLNPAAPAAGLVALALFMLGWLVQAQVVYLAATLILGTLVQAAWFRAPLPTVQLSRTVRARVGGTGTLHVQVRNQSSRMLPPAVLEANLPGLECPTIGVPGLAPGATHETTVTPIAVARGGADDVQVTVVQWGLFRVASRSTVLELPVTVRVHPPQAEPLPVLHTGAEGADHLGRRPGTELDTVREWQQGDSRRAVQWRATARHGRLVVADRRDPDTRVLQLLVLGQACKGAEPAIARAAATVSAAARHGVPVRCVSFDSAGRPRSLRHGNDPLVGDWAAMLGLVGTGRPQAPTPAAVLRELIPDAGVLVLALPDCPPALLDVVSARGPVTRLLPDGTLR